MPVVMLLTIAFLGTMNPRLEQAGLLMSRWCFVPVEHAVLTRETADAERTKAFVRYSLVGGLASAGGALAAAPAGNDRAIGRLRPGFLAAAPAADKG